MRIGVVSDTHDRADNVARIVELFNAARVERVVHTGDITRPNTLELFGRLAMPLVGVYGNNDHELDALAHAARAVGAEFRSGVLARQWHGRRIGVIHDPAELEPERLAGWDLLLHGHTHRHVQERVGDTLVFNPGECAGMMAGHNRIGIVDLAQLDFELLYF